MGQPHEDSDCYWKFTVAGAVFLCVIEVVYWGASLPGFWLPTADAVGGTAFGRDFLNTWIGGRSALGKGPAAWFDFAAYNAYLKSLIGAPNLHEYVWSYPPHILLFIWPVGLLPYLPALVLWIGLGCALFLFTAVRCGVERGNLLFIAVAPAVALNMFFGQNGFVTASILIGGLCHLDRRPLLAGVLFGVLTVKPQLGLLLPVMLMASGRWRVIAAAAATTVLLIGVSILLYGADIWLSYFDKVLPMQHHLQEHGTGLLMLIIPSAFYGSRLIGLSVAAAWGAQAVVSATTLLAVIWVFWRARDKVLSDAFLIIATFLFSPYTMNYDMVVFGWALVMLRQHRQLSLAPIDHAMIIGLWMLAVMMMVAGAAYIPIATIMLSASAARLLWLMAGPALSLRVRAHARGFTRYLQPTEAA